MNLEVVSGDCLDILKLYEENSIDACITDPPYGMSIAGESWDGDVPTVEIWSEVLRTLKPGAFCLSFCSPELYHRMATRVEDAGFRILDQIMWMTTTKMPKNNRLKPAHEPIVVAQKPFTGTIEANFQEWGTGKIDTETTRVPWEKEPPKGWVAQGAKRRTFGKDGNTKGGGAEYGTVDANPLGRYPSNIIGEVLPEHQRYFYAPRATRKEKGEGNDHPTVKPVSLMEYLVRIYTREEHLVLDPFCGSGTTGVACSNLQRNFIGIDKTEEYAEIARKRIQLLTSDEPIV